MTLCSYANDGFYDEIIDADSRPRSGAAALIRRIAALEEGAIRANPRQYITQPTLSLSRAPIIVDEHLEGRHLDVKYFILQGSVKMSIGVALNHRLRR